MLPTMTLQGKAKTLLNKVREDCMSKKWRLLSIWAIGIVLVAVISISVLYNFSGPRRLVGLDTPIHQDDFVYSVTAIGRTRAISNRAASATARGEFYIVAVRVENNARRVSFVWDERIPRIIDARGRRWDHSSQGQAALDAAITPSFSIPAGESRTFQAVFDVPLTIEKPTLVFDNGILMGDVFNLVAYRRI